LLCYLPGDVNTSFNLIKACSHSSFHWNIEPFSHILCNGLKRQTEKEEILRMLDLGVIEPLHLVKKKFKLMLSCFFFFWRIFNPYFVLLLCFCASVFNIFVIHSFCFCFWRLLFEVSLGFSCLFNILITILLPCWSFVIEVDKISDKTKHIMKISHINVNIYDKTVTSQQK
jgi:hypothetical protein